MVDYKHCTFCHRSLCQEDFELLQDGSSNTLWCTGCSEKGQARAEKREVWYLNFIASLKKREKMPKNERGTDLYDIDEDYLLQSLSLHEGG